MESKLRELQKIVSNEQQSKSSQLSETQIAQLKSQLKDQEAEIAELKEELEITDRFVRVGAAMNYVFGESAPPSRRQMSLVQFFDCMKNGHNLDT